MEKTPQLRELARLAVGEGMDLPRPGEAGEMALEEALARRRSVRSFSPKEPGFHQAAQLLWAAQGVTSEDGLRAAPSAGAGYPLETYLACVHGLLRYEPAKHAVTKAEAEDIRGPLASACFGQAFIAEAPLSIIFSAVFERTTSRYGDRGIRYVYMDVGHAAQNVHLQAEALGLCSVPVGAFDDEAVADVLRLPSDQRPVYIVSIGFAARA
jgi:SagB-type dehydrogenase family enzyme